MHTTSWEHFSLLFGGNIQVFNFPTKKLKNYCCKYVLALSKAIRIQYILIEYTNLFEIFLNGVALKILSFEAFSITFTLLNKQK